MKNLLLGQLGQDDFQRLEPYLKITPFTQHSVLFEAEQEIKHVYFPTSAVVSLVVTLESGGMVEAAMVGSDGVVGASAALDGHISLSLGIVQLSGDIVVCSIDGLKSVALQSPKLLSLLIRHEQTVYAQAQQSAACFASHQCSGTSLPLATARERPGGHRHSTFHARIFGGNARGPANERDCRRAHPAVCRSDQVRPRENSDPRCGSAARRRM
jgi:CRP-like cAMP-binding protein